MGLIISGFNTLWQSKMSEAIATLNDDGALALCDAENAGNIATISDEELESDIARDYRIEHISVLQEDQDHLSAVDPLYLLKDQRRAYDIIDWHLAETLAGQAPPQLLMLIPGDEPPAALYAPRHLILPFATLSDFAHIGIGIALARSHSASRSLTHSH